jgi:hypothetical protein
MQAYQFEQSGKLKPQSPEVLKKADEGASIIAYTDGVTASGRPYYAYIAVKPSKYREFYERTKARETMRLGDYGKIIVYGYETKPPAGVVQHMKEKYSFDDEYEAKLQAEVARQRTQFSIDQEERRLLDIVAMMKSKKK